MSKGWGRFSSLKKNLWGEETGIKEVEKVPVEVNLSPPAETEA
jgi:hypothetical protein